MPLYKKTNLFLPLDVPTLEVGGIMLSQVAEFYDVIKVGHELMSNVGAPTAINLPKVFGKQVFADTKFYDIPNTVKKAAMAITSHGVDYFNVMAEGMKDMMYAALEGSYSKALEWGIPRPKIIAVTIPTNQNTGDLFRKGMKPDFLFDPENDEDDQTFMTDIVIKLADEAMSAGVDCLLSSPLEAPILIKRYPNVEILTPGIRNPDSPPDDQNRKMSPYEARMHGITGMVIGRLVTNPPIGKTMKQMAESIRADIARAELDCRKG